MNIKENIKNFIAVHSALICTVPAVLWQLFFLYIPLLLVLYASVRSLSEFNVIDLSNYYTIIFNSAYFWIIGRSALIAFCVTLLSLLCAYPVAYFLALKVHKKWKNVLLFLLTVPFWTNFLIQIYSWVFILDYNGLINMILLNIGLIDEPLHMINNMYALLLVMLYYYLPFMIMPLYSILEKIQYELLEASMDLGATHWQTLRRITIPLSLSGIKTGVFLVFVPAFGEFAIPAIIGGSKQMFVGSLVTHYFLNTRDNQLGSAFTIVSGGVLIACALCFNWLCTAGHVKEYKEVE